MVVYVKTDKKCKRCNGRGIGMWGSIYGECYRCGGDGFEAVPDVAATLKEYTEMLARLQADGEKHKATLQAGIGGVLTLGHARRELDFARRTYKSILMEQQAFIAKQGARKNAKR